MSAIGFFLLYRENLKNLQAAREAKGVAEASRKFTLKAIDSSFRYTAEKILQNVPQSNALKLQLHQKALEIETELAEQRGFDDESLHRLSIAHHLVANDAENCNQFELASLHREQCIEIVKMLAKEYPANASYQFDIFMNRFQKPQGSMSNEQYLEWLIQTRSFLLAAMSLSPNNPDYEDADAAICYRLGFVDSSRSGEWLDRAIQKSLELGHQHPDRTHYFKYAIMGHQALAEEASQREEWREASQHCVQALELIEKNYQTSHDIADILTATVDTLWEYGRALEHIDIAKAIEVYDRYSLKLLALEARDTKYQACQWNLAEARLRQAILQHQLGHLAASRAALTAASTTLEGFEPERKSDANELIRITSEIAEFEMVLTKAEAAAAR